MYKHFIVRKVRSVTLLIFVLMLLISMKTNKSTFTMIEVEI